jgi:hypothetical protein
MDAINPLFTNNPKLAGPNSSGQPSSNSLPAESRENLYSNAQLPSTNATLNALNRPEPYTLPNLDAEFRPKESSAPKRIVRGILDFVKNGVGSAKGLCSGLFTNLSSWSRALISNPTALTWCSGIGAAVVAVMSVKNIFHGINIAVGRRPQEQMPSLAYLFQGFLQGGLTAALFSNILGTRNPLAKREGNRLIVTNKMMIGGAVAPALMGLWLQLAEGNTFLNRIPGIGPMLGEVAKMPLSWLKDAFSNPDKNVPSANIPGAAAGQAG